MRLPRKLRGMLEHMLNERLGKGPNSLSDGMRSEIHKALDSLFSSLPGQFHYPRIMGQDEQSVITPQAFQYLLDLMKEDQLDPFTFEKIMNLCVHLSAVSANRPIDLERMAQIVNLIFFSGVNETTWKTLVNIVVGEDEPTPRMPMQ